MLGSAYGFLATYLISFIFHIPGVAFAVGTVSFLDILRILSGILILTFMLPIYFRFGELAVRYFIIALMALGVLLQISILISTSTSPHEGCDLIDRTIKWFTHFDKVNGNLFIFGV